MKPVSVLKPLMLLTIILCQVPGYAQQAPASKAQPKQKPNASSPPASSSEPKLKPNTAGANSFVCPDPKAKAACDSYQELKKAKDWNLKNDFMSKTYICFRPEIDQFFSFSFREPPFPVRRSTKDLGEMDNNASIKGMGTVTTFNKGIVDNSTIPNFPFFGIWTYGRSKLETFFVSVTTIKTQNDYQAQRTVRIDESRIDIIAEYINMQGKLVDYKLAIQRSTGRYSESFFQEDEKSPFDRNGRCIVPK